GGAWASRYGGRLVSAVGLVFAGAGMLFMGFTDKFFYVAIFGVISGLGSGAVNIAVMGLWPAWFSTKKRGMAAGIAVSGSSLGLILTGFIVPRIMEAYGEKAWQTCWILFGSITLLLAVGSYIVLRDKPAEMGLEPIGKTAADITPMGTVSTNWKQVYFSAPVWFLGIVYTAFGFSYIIFMTFFVKHLISDAGFTALAAGRLFMVMGGFSVFSGLIWGSISDSIGRPKTLMILYLIHTLAFAMFAAGGKPFYFVISAVLYGITAWSIPAIMSAACGDLLGPQLAPASLGFITLFFGIGQVLGPVAAGAMADAAGSFSPVFVLASAISLMGAAGAGMLIKVTAYHGKQSEGISFQLVEDDKWVNK
ncbi:MAG TPA: MFS transporter, partial [Desulfobacteria bacterium]|nr:MFS transporter [Desulfobacteria bacterium]